MGRRLMPPNFVSANDEPSNFVPASNEPSNFVPASNEPISPSSTSDPLAQAVRGGNSVEQALRGPSGKVFEIPPATSFGQVARQSVPLAVGLATAPLLGGMSVPAALAFEGLMQAGTEGYMQATGINEPSKFQLGLAATAPAAARGIMAAGKYGLQKTAPYFAGAGAALRGYAGKTMDALVKSLEPKIKSQVLYERLRQVNPNVSLSPIWEAADKVVGSGRQSLLRSEPNMPGTYASNPEIVTWQKELADTEAAIIKRGNIVPVELTAKVADLKAKLATGASDVGRTATGGTFTDPLAGVRQIAETLKNLKGDPKLMTEAYGADAVEFQRVWATMKELNNLIGKAKVEHGADYAGLMTLKRGFWEALDKMASQGTGKAATMLREANAAYKQEIAQETMDDIVFKNFKQFLEGSEALNTTAARAKNQLQKALRDDEFLKDTFPPGSIDQINSALDKIKILPVRQAPSGADAGGKLIYQRGGIGASIGGTIGGAVSGTPFGIAMGATAGTGISLIAAPIISKALQSPRGTEMLIKLIQSPGGIDYPKIAALTTFMRGLTAESAKVAEAVKATTRDPSVSFEKKLAGWQEIDDAKQKARAVEDAIQQQDQGSP